MKTPSGHSNNTEKKKAGTKPAFFFFILFINSIRPGWKAVGLSARALPDGQAFSIQYSLPRISSSVSITT